jgi:hypothetical protein
MLPVTPSGSAAQGINGVLKSRACLRIVPFANILVITRASATRHGNRFQCENAGGPAKDAAGCLCDYWNVV